MTVSGLGSSSVHDPAVGQEDDPVGVGRRGRVVGDHDHRPAELADQAQQRRAPRRRTGSRGCRWARRRTRPPAGRQGPGDGDALLLPAGQLGGPVREAPARPDRLDDAWPARPGRPPARDVRWQRDVVARRERRQQVVRLEDEPDLVAAQPGQRVARAGRRSRHRRSRPARRWPRSRPAMQCIRVDLPEPEGPMIALKEPADDVQVPRASAVTAAFAFSVYSFTRSRARAAGGECIGRGCSSAVPSSVCASYDAERWGRGPGPRIGRRCCLAPPSWGGATDTSHSRWSGTRQAPRRRRRIDQLDPVPRADLGQQVVHVGLHRGLGHDQLRGDLRVRQPARDQPRARPPHGRRSPRQRRRVPPAGAGLPSGAGSR